MECGLTFENREGVDMIEKLLQTTFQFIQTSFAPLPILNPLSYSLAWVGSSMSDCTSFILEAVFLCDFYDTYISGVRRVAAAINRC